MHGCVGGAVMCVKCVMESYARLRWRRSESVRCKDVLCTVCWQRSDVCEVCNGVLCTVVLAAQ